MRITHLLLAALACASVSANAQVRQPESLENPPAAAIERLATDRFTPADVQELAPDEAKDLLKSTAGANWHVLEVRAPACDKPVPKEKRKECEQISKRCDDATKIANKYRAQITCSALYQQTTVVLTTVPTPKKGPYPVKHHSVGKHSVSKAPARSPGKEVGKRNNCD